MAGSGERTTTGVVLNADDSFISRVRDNLPPDVRVRWFGVDPSIADRLPELQEADVRFEDTAERPRLGADDGLLLPADDGRTLTYRFDARAERTGIPSLLTAMRDAGIAFKDLDTRESSLEDIFVDLVHEQRSAA